MQRPYRWNLRRLNPGRTLDIGCGIGRCLQALPSGSIGVDHNAHSIEVLREKGLDGFSPAEFRNSSFCRPAAFDSLLFAHVLEHMSKDAGIELMREYLPLLRRGGQVILICPQERGFASDHTHVFFYDHKALRAALDGLGLEFARRQSFPFPRFAGRLFVYNEFVVVGIKPDSNPGAQKA
ncbi:MAG TPA: class I SAM-dependent methyltransferase [Steroidobacteraceae bacterium]